MTQPTRSQDEGAAAGGPRPPAPTGKKRRWVRRVLIVGLVGLAVVVLLVALAPTIASTAWGRGIVERQIDARLKGSFEIRQLAAAWFAPCSVGDVRVRDEAGREVLRLPKVGIASGLFGLLRGGLNSLEVALEQPQATVIIEDDGSTSLAKALSSVEAKTSESSALPEISVHVRVQDGVVTVLRPGQPEVRLSKLDVDARADTAGALIARLAGAADLGGSVAVDVQLQRWVEAGAVALSAAEGSIDLVTEKPIDLTALDRLLPSSLGLAGQLATKFNAKLHQGRITVEYSADARQLAAAGTGTVLAEPIDLAASGNLALAGEDLAGAITLKGDLGNLNGDFSVPAVGTLRLPAPGGLAAALLSGGQSGLALPDAALSASANIDLAAVARAMPALLRVREDVRVSAGKLTVDSLKLAGGGEPRVTLDANLSDLAAERAGRKISWAPMTARLAAVCRAEGGLQLERAELESEFATLTASGSVEALRAELRTDLAGLHTQLSEVFDLNVEALAGTVNATVDVQRNSANEVSLALQGSAADVRFADAGRRFNIAKARFSHQGALALQDGAVTRITSSATSIGLDDRVDVQATGWFEPETSTYSAQAKVVNIDLAYIASLSAGAGAPLPHRLTGLVRGDVNVARDPAGAALRTSGKLDAQNLTVDERAISGPVACEWEDASYAPDSRRVAATRVVVQSEPLQLTATDLGGGDAQADAFSGNVSFAAELATLTDLLKVFGVSIPNALAGRLQGELTLSRDAGDETVHSDGRIKAEGLSVDGHSFGAQSECAWTAATFVPSAGTLAADAIVVDSAPLDLKVNKLRGGTGPTDALAGEVEISADLAAVPDLAKLAGVEIAETLAGELNGSLALRRAAGESAVRSDGRVSVKNLAIAGRTLGALADCTWADVAFAPESGRLTAESLAVKSEPLDLKATNVRGGSAKTEEFGGDVQVRADLAALGQALIAAGVLAEAPGVAGSLTAQAAVTTVQGAIDVNGKADIRELVVPGEAAWAPRGAKLVYDARVEPGAESMALRKFELDSDLAAGHLAGTITELSGARNVDLQGKYRCDWDRVLPIIYAFAPQLRDQLGVRGVAQGPIRVRGQLAAPEGESVLAGLTATTATGWEEADVFGVDLGKTELKLELDDGVLEVPAGPIPTTSGTVRVGGSVNLKQSPPLLDIPGQLAVLEGVHITPELARSLLSRFNPLFGRATAIEGKAGLVVRDLQLPLGAASTTGGSGGGTLSLEEFKIAPDGVLAELLSLGNLARDMYVVEVSGLTFTVKEGRIHYRDLTMRFVQDKFDLSFYGSVGFDDSVDLFVSIPVGEKVLEKVGMSTGTLDYSRLLAGLRVDVPIVGTRQNPRLDFSKVNVKGLLEQAMRKQGEQAVTGGGILDILDQISGKKDDAKSSKPAGDRPTATPRPTPRPRADRPAPSSSPQPKSRGSGVKVGKKSKTPKKDGD